MVGTLFKVVGSVWKNVLGGWGWVRMHQALLWVGEVYWENILGMWGGCENILGGWR